MSLGVGMSIIDIKDLNPGMKFKVRIVYFPKRLTKSDLDKELCYYCENKYIYLTDPERCDYRLLSITKTNFKEGYEYRVKCIIRN